MRGEWDDVREALDIYRRWKEMKQEVRRRERELEQDLAHREQRLRQERELERLERLSRMSLEVLVLAADSPEKARLLAGLARTRALSGLPPEKIALLLQEGNPRVAEALREVLGHIHAQGSPKTLALYEQLLERLREQADLTREDYRRSLQTFAQMFERFTESVKAVAQRHYGPGHSSGQT
jgi:hypothetical protein